MTPLTEADHSNGNFKTRTLCEGRKECGTRNGRSDGKGKSKSKSKSGREVPPQLPKGRRPLSALLRRASRMTTLRLRAGGPALKRSVQVEAFFGALRRSSPHINVGAPTEQLGEPAEQRQFKASRRPSSGGRAQKPRAGGPGSWLRCP